MFAGKKSVFAFGAVAMLLVSPSREPLPVTTEPEFVGVMVAAAKIKSGEVFTRQNTKLIRILKSEAGANTVSAYSELQERGARLYLDTGDILRSDMLSERGDIASQPSLPHGKRLVTIPVRRSNALSVKPQPGDTVFVFLQIDQMLPGKSQSVYYLPIDAEVFYADSYTGDEDDVFVSLLVSMYDGMILRLGKKKGTLILSKTPCPEL